MQKKKVFIVSIVSLLCGFLFIFLINGNFKIIGFTPYAMDTFCGVTEGTTSSFTASQTCIAPPSNDGGILNGNGMTLDCAGFSNFLLGNSATPGTFGIKTIADNIIIKNCDVQFFNYGLNLSNSTTVLDSKLNDAVNPNTKEAWLAPSKNATFLNVSFTDTAAKIQVQSGANLFVQWYVVVNASNATGPISGASVQIYNETNNPQYLFGTTNAQGLAYFNLTDKILRNAGDGGTIDLNYTINASSASGWSGNTTYNLTTNYGIQMINVNMTYSVADTIPPLVTIINPQNRTYKLSDFPLIFNVSLNETGNVGYSLNGGVNNITMTANASATGFNATNSSLADGSYTFRVYANDTAGNRNDTASVVFSVDTTYPLIDYGVGTEAGGAKINRGNIVINVTASDTNLANITIRLFNSTSLVNLTNSTTSPNFVNITGLADGIYYFNASAIDYAGNVNSTSTRNVTIDTTAPAVTIVSPLATTYTVNSYFINITINEAGYCEYSLDSGATNNTLTNSGNVDFYVNKTGVSNAAYTLRAYCNDTVGNRNSASVSFTVSVSSGGSGSGGSGGDGVGFFACDSTTWTNCTGWTACTNKQQYRMCTSNCGTQRNESRWCDLCVNECSADGKSCSGDTLQTCQFIGGCYKIVSNENCAAVDGGACLNAECISCNSVLEYAAEASAGTTGGSNRTAVGFFIPRLSSFIPHGSVPAGIIDAGGILVGVAAIAGISWIIFLWIAGLMLPLFWVKLKHYSVPVFDTSNHLKMFNSPTPDIKRVTSFLMELEKHYEPMVFADKERGVVRYLVKRGFIEMRLDSPFIVTGHFTRKRDASAFKEALREVTNKFGGRKLKILDSVEKASIIEALRALRRNKKSEKELNKLFRK